MCTAARRACCTVYEHAASCLYRGVNPVAFVPRATNMTDLYRDVFSTLLDKGLVEDGDLVLLTKGDLAGVSGGTNSMKIVAVNGAL